MSIRDVEPARRISIRKRDELLVQAEDVVHGIAYRWRIGVRRCLVLIESDRTRRVGDGREGEQGVVAFRAGTDVRLILALPLTEIISRIGRGGDRVDERGVGRGGRQHHRADGGGAVVVPAGAGAELLAMIDRLARKQAVILDAAKAPDVDLGTREQVMDASTRAR